MSTSTDRAARPGTIALYVLFALTGIGLVLPGTLLPLLARRWGWDDGRSGSLFLCFFVGSTLGALCARGRPWRLLVLAALSIALSVAMLDRLRGPGVLVASLVCGTGLGIAMTTTSLVQSRRSGPAHRLASLTRLNLVWAVGACSGPFLLLKASAAQGLGFTLHAYAGLVLCCGVATAWLLRREPLPASGAWQAWRHMRDVPAYFIVTLPLSTGVEAGLGGWLTTYAARQHTAGSMVGTGTALWAGLLLSRLLLSGKDITLAQQRWMMPAFSSLSLVGILLDLVSRTATATALGAFLVGFGVGPLYPYLLSRLLDRGEAGNAGFLLAGTGSAVLPLLIGVVSQHAHSLHTGLLVPLLGSGLLLAALLQGAPAKTSAHA